jgi:hypothetical protein
MPSMFRNKADSVAGEDEWNVDTKNRGRSESQWWRVHKHSYFEKGWETEMQIISLKLGLSKWNLYIVEITGLTCLLQPRYKSTEGLIHEYKWIRKMRYICTTEYCSK